MSETSTTSKAAEIRSALLGSQVNANYAGTVGVIGHIDQSISGNTILRIGNHTIGDDHWVSGAAHVVLTPEERERLIASLVSHRSIGEQVSE